ncbi:MAG: hypothetical protein WKF71_04355 [Pyrinomonadaceae bacterium]
MNQNIFREYDIRGIVGQDLTAETVSILARAIGTFFLATMQSALPSGSMRVKAHRFFAIYSSKH